MPKKCDLRYSFGTMSYRALFEKVVRAGPLYTTLLTLPVLPTPLANVSFARMRVRRDRENGSSRRAWQAYPGHYGKQALPDIYDTKRLQYSNEEHKRVRVHVLDTKYFRRDWSDTNAHAQ